MATFISFNSMVNKQLYLYFLIATGVCFSCKETLEKKAEAETQKETEIVLCELIKSTVIIEDTTFQYSQDKGVVWSEFYRSKDSTKLKAFPGNISHMSTLEFESFWYGLYDLFKSDKVVVADPTLNLMNDYTLKSGIFKKCDSVTKYEDYGKPNAPKMFMCDSTSTLVHLRMIDFYEKWYYSRATGNIRKDVMAYCLFNNNNRDEKYLPSFYIFKNKETYEQLKPKLQRKK